METFKHGPGACLARNSLQSGSLEKTPNVLTGRRILVADDKAAGRELVRAALESCGHIVVEATDGIVALQMAARERPDLIILDLQMPNADGYAVIARLRADERFAATPMIALTASAMPADRQRALSAGFSAYIAKPVPIAVLRSEVERLLA
ncbi:MAG: response regulator [Bryobacteraceae bacterium]|nr:response regulator [Bryobacteraceae bacterium]